MGASFLCVLGASACSADFSAPTGINRATLENRQAVSSVFQSEETTATVSDAALTLAIALLPETTPSADVVDAANSLLRQPDAIALSQLGLQPTVSCVDTVAPSGAGIEDVAAILVLQNEAVGSVSQFEARLRALLPDSAFQVERVPTVADLEQCPTVSPLSPTPTPNPEEASPTPDPEVSSPTPDPEEASPTPDPEDSSPTPDPEEASPTPDPEGTSPTPTPAEEASPTPQLEEPASPTPTAPPVTPSEE